jgi:soluble lytic murein transglycosylase-like protein
LVNPVESSKLAPQKGAIRAPNRPPKARSGAQTHRKQKRNEKKKHRLAQARRLSKGWPMKSVRLLVLLAAVAAIFAPRPSLAQHSQYDALVAAHARANNVPEALVHRVIIHESRYQPQLVGRGGTIGLMQIKLATARGLGYTGTAEGLRDPDTNLTYAVKYLAGAYRAANGDHRRAMAYYASGYYYAAKRQRHARHEEAKVAKQSAEAPADTNAEQVPKP